MKRTVAVMPAAMLLFACGGEPRVASRSAAAYRDAQGKGIETSGGHEHGGHQASATTSSAAGHDGETTSPAAADPHPGHTSGAPAPSPATPAPVSAPNISA